MALTNLQSDDNIGYIDKHHDTEDGTDIIEIQPGNLLLLHLSTSFPVA